MLICNSSIKGLFVSMDKKLLWHITYADTRFHNPGTVFGDPHFFTFDGQAYTFNGKGEFTLVKADTDRHKFDVQGRFEQVITNDLGLREATVLTSVSARDNQSSTIEIRLRPREAQWRYKLDVIVDHQRIFFDRYPQKIQTFPGE